MSASPSKEILDLSILEKWCLWPGLSSGSGVAAIEVSSDVIDDVELLVDS